MSPGARGWRLLGKGGAGTESKVSHLSHSALGSPGACGPRLGLRFLSDLLFVVISGAGRFLRGLASLASPLLIFSHDDVPESLRIHLSFIFSFKFFLWP